MVNARYDHFLPLETSQNVMFRFQKGTSGMQCWTAGTYRPTKA
jgi:hypothetical protein